jgi:very-short-patch-repair endonuclease
VDFLCREQKIVVEVDGATHGTNEELGADAARTEFLESVGFRVFRARNDEVYDNLDGVLESLLAFVGIWLRSKQAPLLTLYPFVAAPHALSICRRPAP